ncbi:hypothetical protein RJ640_023601 [Escallonia rubra]|uniref:Uncharacterized protein n=1 Tax=Escallonia rubra TaxID=112253 RepID=A0AA88QXX4_9ASTE|nr:hypothetical protein RJ640_023601 [Escallonia rubra]
MTALFCCPALPSAFRLQPRRSKRVHGVRCCSGSPNHKEKDNSTPQLLKIARDNLSVSGVDDIVNILKSDYGNAYFVTGVFSSAIYTEDCIFEDPTIKFSGRELYSRNLKLLVPFFDQPSITLQKIDKGADADTNIVLAFWKLRTYLKLPWRPLISVDGSTIYELDDEFKVIRHAESWNVSALEAVGQIFTPGDGKHGE